VWLCPSFLGQRQVTHHNCLGMDSVLLCGGEAGCQEPPHSYHFPHLQVVSAGSCRAERPPAAWC
jgi:hypothetical protein